jgi:hypothetical protein
LKDATAALAAGRIGRSAGLCRLEFKNEQLATNSASQLAEIGRKTDAFNRLTIERDAGTSAVYLCR